MSETKTDSIRATLNGVDREQYGDQHQEHILELYKLYLEMADRISSRRERANTFFLSLNAAIAAFLSYWTTTGDQPNSSLSIATVAIAGCVLAFLWSRIIRSYRDLNSAKFKVIHAIESRLPLKPYDSEWEAVGRGENPRLYRPFTHIEMVVPWVFFCLHAFTIARVTSFERIADFVCWR